MSSIVEHDLMQLLEQNMSCYDFEPGSVFCMLKNEWVSKIEGESVDDFGLEITDKGRAHLVKAGMIKSGSAPGTFDTIPAQTVRSIDIPDDAWLADGSEDGSLLRAQIIVNGCPMHLEAHAVTREYYNDGDGDRYVQASEGNDSDFSGLNLAHECDAPQVEIEIKGRKYVLFACAWNE